MDIVIIDYKGGNTVSVLNAIKKIGLSARIASSPKEIHPGNIIVLPGVGAAKATLDSLTELNINDHICELIKKKQCAYLGICVGLQILFSHSEEGDTNCWGLARGKVEKFNSKKQLVPLMGWMPVRIMKDSPEIIKNGIASREYFYFVNSYFTTPLNEKSIAGKTTYDQDFCSLYINENIAATQFHVEKSGKAGLKLLPLLLSYLEKSLIPTRGEKVLKSGGIKR